jgi:drug/metabolite transporter (DMT)-like permease
MTVPFRRWRASPLAAMLALLCATAIWGGTFPVVKDAITPAGPMPVFDYLAWRFGLATVVMAALRPRAIARLGRSGRGHGLLLGCALGIGFIVQTTGLQRTPSSVSAFVTGMFVVFTPLVTAVILRRRVSRGAWIAVLVATLGLALLSLGTSGKDTTHASALGLALTLGCALAYAIHIVGLGEWSARYNSYGLAVVQLGTVTVLCSIAAIIGGDGLSPPSDGDAWFAVALTALAATALAFIIQTWAQSLLDPTRASVIMTMEPVFAGLFAVGFAGESMSRAAVLGAGLVIAGMLLTELGAGQRNLAVERLEA